MLLVLRKFTVLMHGNFSRHCANGISHINGIDFDRSYSPVSHADSLRIYIAIANMHRLTSRVLDISNAFQNTNVPILEGVCVYLQ